MTTSGNLYAQTVIRLHIDKIEQRLLWYDNLPDGDVVWMVKRWRELHHRLRELRGEMNGDDS